MSGAGSNPKIRQIAIVLTSVDGQTARKIVAALPQDIGKKIRQLIGNLGIVSQAERDEAFAALKPIFKVNFGDRTSTNYERPTQDSASRIRSVSPAEELLRQTSSEIDRADFATDGQPLSSTESFRSLHSSNGQATTSSEPSTAIDWSCATCAEWAQVMQNERPLIIATLLTQAPQYIASDILQELPSPIALQALAAMPKIGATAADVFTEINNLLQNKLREFRHQSLTNQWGRLKAKSIFESLPLEMRTQWSKELRQLDPSLASELGLDQEKESQVKGPKLLVITPEPTDNLQPVPEQGELPSKTSPIHLSSQTFDAQAKAFQAFDAEDFNALIHLSLDDLAKVVRASDPQIIMTAMCGASKKWIARFEKLMHPKDVRRLHQRLQSTTNVTISQIDRAQSTMVQTASALGILVPNHEQLAAA